MSASDQQALSTGCKQQVRGPAYRRDWPRQLSKPDSHDAGSSLQSECHRNLSFVTSILLEKTNRAGPSMDYNNKRTGLEKRSVGLPTLRHISQISANILCQACDLCHIKKIKCDNNKPKCSHCIVYKAECKYTPHIQKRRRKENKVQTR